jgi:hypothetical protein
VWQPNSLFSPFLCPTQLVVEKLEHRAKLVSQLVPFYFPHAFSIKKQGKHGKLQQKKANTACKPLHQFTS